MEGRSDIFKWTVPAGSVRAAVRARTPFGQEQIASGGMYPEGRLCPKACIWVHPSAEKVLRKSRELEANWSR